jgi:hypothetical protein
MLDFQLMRVDTPRDGSQAHTSTAAQQLGSSDGRKERSSKKKIGKHFALPCLCDDSRCVKIRNAHIVGHQTVALDKEPRRARAQVYAVADMHDCHDCHADMHDCHDCHDCQDCHDSPCRRPSI